MTATTTTTTRQEAVAKFLDALPHWEAAAAAWQEEEMRREDARWASLRDTEAQMRNADNAYPRI